MNKVLITGAGGGIGKKVAELFASKGFEVDSIGREEVDLSDRATLEEYLSTKKMDYDVVIHCAAINDPKPFEEIGYDDLDKTTEVNLFSFYRIIQSVLPHMKKAGGGKIVGVSSIYGTISRAKRLPYSISKHGMGALVKTLALEVGCHNILVNSVSPGFVDTKLTHKNLTEAEIKALEDKIPVRRLAKPEEIANVIYFLCSEENTYITGQNILVDGGYIVGGFQE
ncbi:MAG: SDR family oxidoreductase [Patescibacteria group bacterium]